MLIHLVLRNSDVATKAFVAITTWKGIMKKVISVVFLVFLVFLASNGTAQDNRVKFEFKVDTEPVEEKFKVILYADGGIIEPEIIDNSFIVPLEIQQQKFVDVRFVSEKYDLYFQEVPISAFKSKWEIGVDYKPFEEENINSERSYEDVDCIYYMKFDRFQITVELKKKKPKDGF